MLARSLFTAKTWKIMTEKHPTNPQEYKEWVRKLERDWLAGLIPNPQTVAIIVLNEKNEVLLQLRDDNPNVSFANFWTLPGGVVDPNEVPDSAARRELFEETGLQTQLSHWKVFDKKQPNFKPIIEQHVYTGITHYKISEMVVGEGQGLQFFGKEKLQELSIAFDFDTLLDEFFEQVKGSR
jgi:8-oxo-dGTP diphosphatase